MFKNIIYLFKKLVTSILMIIFFLFLVHLLVQSSADPKVSLMQRTLNLHSSVKKIDINSERTSDHVTMVTTLETTETTENTTDKIMYSSYDTFRYIHLPPQVCEMSGGKNDPFLVIVVKSSVYNLGHREAIRKTWGKHKNPNIKLVFLLGYSPLIKHYINMEYSLYKDIVQQDFTDDYFNNTLKTIMAFDWVVTHCPKSKFVFFVDDDYFVNLPKILHYLDKNKSSKTLIAGHKYIGAIPRRRKDSKWYVSWEDYPNRTWPPYLSGGSIMMAMPIAKLLKDEIPYIKPTFIDDVFLGVVAKSLDIELWNERRFSVSYRPDKLVNLLSAHRYGAPQNLILEWKRVRCKHNALFQKLHGNPQC